MPHSFKWQFKTASKRRRTDLINTVGGAKALDDIKDMVALPENAKKYIHAVEEFIGAKVSSVSTSPERDDTILIENPFDI